MPEYDGRRLTIILPDRLYDRVKADSENGYGGRMDSKGAVIRRIIEAHYAEIDREIAEVEVMVQRMKEKFDRAKQESGR